MKFKSSKFVGVLTAAAAAVTLFAGSASAAAKTSVKSRSYGVDVSSYQSTNLSSYQKAGAQFAIVKVSEGIGYRNPNAKSQVASAKSNGLMPMAYHFANFSNNSSRAKSEANYAISSAKAVKVPSGSYLVCDWETSSTNYTSGSKSSNTSAIIAFMDKVKAAGFQPLLYSGAYLLNSNINTNRVVKKYPNSLWVASYASAGRIDTPNFANFPSMNGVLIWQFTENWRGLNVDGNISLLPLSITSAATSSSKKSTSTSSSSSSSQAAVAQAPVAKTKKLIMSKSYVYTSAGKRTKKYKKAYTYVYVLGGIVKIGKKTFYKIATNQYLRVSNIDGARYTLKKKATIYNSKGKKVKKVAALKKGSSVAVYGGARKIGKKTCYRINKGRYILKGTF